MSLGVAFGEYLGEVIFNWIYLNMIRMLILQQYGILKRRQEP